MKIIYSPLAVIGEQLAPNASPWVVGGVIILSLIDLLRWYLVTRGKGGSR